jgi:hypothetical protein
LLSLALKIELERVRRAALPAGCKQRHQALFLDAPDRDGIVVAGAEARIFVRSTSPNPMRWIAASPRAKHSLCGTVRSPSRSHRRTAAQREGRGGGGWESRCDCGEESEFSESHWKTLLILYGAAVQHSLSSGKPGEVRSLRPMGADKAGAAIALARIHLMLRRRRLLFRRCSLSQGRFGWINTCS